MDKYFHPKNYWKCDFLTMLWCKFIHITWWRHQMETFSVLLALCAGNSPVTGEFFSQRRVTQSFEVFFDLRPNKRLSKQSRRRWFETPWHSLWCHSNEKRLSDDWIRQPLVRSQHILLAMVEEHCCLEHELETFVRLIYFHLYVWWLKIILWFS